MIVKTEKSKSAHINLSATVKLCLLVGGIIASILAFSILSWKVEDLDYRLIIIEACEHNHCQNGGICFPLGKNDTSDGYGYACNCTLNFQGKNCEIPHPGMYITMQF